MGYAKDLWNLTLAFLLPECSHHELSGFGSDESNSSLGKPPWKLIPLDDDDVNECNCVFHLRNVKLISSTCPWIEEVDCYKSCRFGSKTVPRALSIVTSLMRALVKAPQRRSCARQVLALRGFRHRLGHAFGSRS